MQLPIKIKMNVNLQKQYVLALLYIMHMKDILDYFFFIFTKTKNKTNPYSNCIKKNEFIWIFLLAEQPVKWFGK